MEKIKEIIRMKHNKFCDRETSRARIGAGCFVASIIAAFVAGRTRSKKLFGLSAIGSILSLFASGMFFGASVTYSLADDDLYEIDRKIAEMEETVEKD